VYIIDVKGKGTKMINLSDYVKMDKAEVWDLLVNGYSFKHIDSADTTEEWLVLADHDADMVPKIYVDGDIVDSLEDENYFAEKDNLICIVGHPRKMTYEMYDEYLFAVEIANRDAEHDARGTANSTYGIFRPSY
jgi:hypothetical protein